MQDSVSSPQFALTARPGRSLQAIANLRRARLSRSQLAPKRPAFSILPNSVIPAVSWQRQPTQPQANRADSASTPAIAIQQASRQASFSAAVDFGPCQRSTQKQSPKQGGFQVCVNDRTVAQFRHRSQAEAMANRLRKWLDADGKSDRLQLKLINGQPAAVADQTVLFTVDARTAKAIRQNSELLAIEWLNQLRQALDAEPLSLVAAQMQLYGLSDTPKGELSGTASWYGSYFHGRLTAAGEIFNQGELTAAHRSLPFNTFLKVTNLETGKSVIVRVNDRGPYVGSRSLDLSREAARALGSEVSGVVSYEAVILAPQVAQRPSTEIALNNTK